MSDKLMTPEEIETMVLDLEGLAPGEKLTYFRGFHLGHCPPDIRRAAWRGHDRGYLRLKQRRMGPPMRRTSGVVEEDWHNGLGPGFEYIAEGCEQRRRIERRKQRVLERA